jgi:4'-phosphopantetheinyl transferase
MPLILKEYVLDDCLLGIWQINEEYDDLINRIHLFPGEQERLDSFGSYSRKIEWLSVRVLLRQLTGKVTTIIYNSERKPFIKGNSYQISISHSHNLTAILLSREKKVGLDLEYMSHEISRLESKFINNHEFITRNGNQKFHLYIHWCAKEAMYKICDKQNISLRQDITLHKFEPEEKGIVKGRVDNEFRHEEFELNYFTLNNYIIVYCCK